MESTLAYHTTGRSAAVFVVNYGGTNSRPLAAASRAFLESPPEGAIDAPLLSPRGILWIADREQLPRLATMEAEGQAAGAGSILIDADEALALVPALSADRIAGGLLEPARIRHRRGSPPTRPSFGWPAAKAPRSSPTPP